MWFEDSCHIEDLFFQFSSGFIFSFNSEPGENLIQIETEFFTPRNWQKLFFADFLQLPNLLYPIGWPTKISTKNASLMWWFDLNITKK